MTERFTPIYINQSRAYSEDEAVRIRFEEAKQDAYKKFFTKFHTYKLYNGEYNDNPLVRDCLDYIKTEEGRGTPFGYFITVNPREGTDVDYFYTKVNKALSKKWIKDVVCTFEQRSDSFEEFYGMHAHMYLRSHSKPSSQVRREFTSVFKSVVGSHKSVNIQLIKQTDEDKIISYILGDKKDPEKLGKCRADVQFRYKNKLPEVIIHGFDDVEKLTEIKFKEKQFSIQDLDLDYFEKLCLTDVGTTGPVEVPIVKDEDMAVVNGTIKDTP